MTKTNRELNTEFQAKQREQFAFGTETKYKYQLLQEAIAKFK
jgi:hypothetical protein